MQTRLLFAVAALALGPLPPSSAGSPGSQDGCRYFPHDTLAAPYVETAPGASQLVTQPPGTSFELNSRVVAFRSGDPLVHGEVVIARDRDDSVHSVIGQAGDQAHLRLTFGRDTSGTGRPRHLLIGPYNYGAAVEYPGVIEFWVEQFSVHNNHTSRLKKEGAWFWVGDEIDAGGLFATSHYDPDLSKAYSVVASDMFNHTSHGSLHFQLRNPIDAFRFQWGAFNAETTLAEIGQDAGAAYLALGPAPAASGELRLCAGCGIRFRAVSGGDIEAVAAAGDATLIHDRLYRADGGALAPGDDAVRDLGLPGQRWHAVHAMQVQSSGALAGGLNEVAWAPAIEFDAQLGNTHKVVLTDDVAESRLVNAVAGQTLVFLLCQDEVGKHKFEWPENVRGAMTIGLQAGRCNAQSFVFDGTSAWAISSGVPNQ